MSVGDDSSSWCHIISTRPSATIVALAVGGVQLGFCGWALLAKVAMSDEYSIKPIVFCMYRETIAALLMLAIAWHSDGLSLPHKGDIPRLMVVGALTFFGIYGYLTAMEYGSASDSALMAPFQPVVTVLLGAMAGIERLTIQRAAGVLLCTAGSLTVTAYSTNEDSKQAPNPQLGFALFGLCAVSAGLNFLTQKQLLLKYPSTLVTAWYYVIAATLTVFVAVPEVCDHPWGRVRVRVSSSNAAESYACHKPFTLTFTLSLFMTMTLAR